MADADQRNDGPGNSVPGTGLKATGGAPPFVSQWRHIARIAAAAMEKLRRRAS